MHDNNSTKLLGLIGVKIKDIEVGEKNILVYIEMPVRDHNCPCCKLKTSKIHDYRTRKIKDVRLQNKPVRLVYRQRRYRCDACGKRFSEFVDFVGKYQRVTKRLISEIIKKLETVTSVKSLANEFSISSCTINRIFDCINYSISELPEVVSIDEFKGNTSEGKYHCIIADPVNHKVMDILKNRTFEDVYKYFKSIRNRDKVKFLVMDMWQPYKSAAIAALPNVKIIIDKFHYIRQCYWAVERVRKEVQKSLPADKRKYMKKSRWLMLKDINKLKDEDMLKLASILQIDKRLRVAYQLKIKFVEFTKAKSSSQASRLLNQWINLAHDSNLLEFQTVIGTLENWRTEILNSFDYKYTNGCIEGFNNKVKVIKRNAFGVRNFSRFRNRIIHCCS